MVGTEKASHWWWFECRNSPSRTPWLQSTLAELEEKTKAMLKLIEEDADSFAQLAEMFYKKRPQLINMVEDSYRAHRSLAERFDQVKYDSGTRLMTPLASPFSFTKYRPEKLMSSMDRTYDSYSEAFDSEESGESEVDNPEQEEESEVDDPEQEEESQVDKPMEEQEVSSAVSNAEVMKLREEIERLKEENKIQKEQLMQKDEEKREVIRQLSLAVEVLKEENVNLRKFVTKNSHKKRSPFEFNKLKAVFLGNLFHGSSKSQTTVIAL